MSDSSKIEWTDATWNFVTGCTEVSAGCDRCYARTFAERWRGVPGHHFERGFDVTLRPERLEQPIRWKRPRRIFVNSMSDLFHADVPTELIARAFAVMAATPQHTYQVLTKRPARMRSLLSREDFGLDVFLMAENEFGGSDRVWPLPNVWLGVSVEDQHWADIRIPVLCETPAAVRFLSCEPLLGPVQIPFEIFRPGGCGCGIPSGCDAECFRSEGPAFDRLHWVIVGGESGPGARLMERAWARSLIRQCGEFDVPVFVKQLGSALGRRIGAGPKGGDMDAWPEELRVREFPTPAKAAA